MFWTDSGRQHADQYDISYFATREAAESALRIAFEFVERMEKLLKARN